MISFYTKVSSVQRCNLQSFLSFPNRNGFCSLSVDKDGYSCTFTAKVHVFHSTFTDYNEIDIKLCEHNHCVLLNSNYKPAHHIKPITPYNVTVQYENGNYTFAWSSGYEKHSYGSILPFQYILRYHQVGQSTEKDLHMTETVYRISETLFDPGTEYIARVYNKIIPNDKYHGTMSHGSAEIRWNTPQAATTMQGIVVLICSAVGLVSLLLFPVARMKIKKIAWVKTPAPSISPLNQTALGSLQFSLSKSHVQQIYSEEISTIDMIIEITARQQLQEHSSVIYSQCHTPYVGPLMEVWAPCLTPDSRNTANNPCNDPDFLPDDGDVEETLLRLSMPTGIEGGFVSLDDLEPSLEIRKDSETFANTPNPACFSQNYCTLTNTAIGLIPTFCTVPCVPNLGLELKGHTSPDLFNMQIEESTPELDTVTLDNLQLSVDE
ncbi:interleukin 21 receptor, tandem duplicate 2 [Ictalurus furcatus]|uniref:interleukin 21 receptor, tandem duplicate 2 n=1 Tax=Ictalurus furcatus TaxID=66913 RepID=UPI00235018DD|nr:interleukin 21 receptor, tandem duplicate 2 [Ictalurus furcatus]